MYLKSVAVCMAAFFSFGIAAQTSDFPNKPIRLVSPFTAGGGTDTIARLVSKKIADSVNWTLVVDNKPGANGTIALGEVARLKADGYTLIIGQTDNLSIAPSMMHVTYDPVKNFTPISLLATAAVVFVVAADSPYRSIKDVLTEAKKRPGEIRVGTSGTGGTLHLVAEQLQAKSGTKMTHIPYKGTTQALNDLAGGHVEISGGSIASVRGLLEGKRIRALAVSGEQRVPALPDVPTLSEEGFSNIAGLGWYGLLGPSGMPSEIVNKINAEINKIMLLPDVQENLTSLGLTRSLGTPEDFARILQNDYATWTQAITAVGLRKE